MTSPGPSLPPPLAETLHLLRLDGTLYCRSHLTAPWGIAIPRLEGMMTFAVITEGHAWLRMGEQPARLLPRGSLTLIPRAEPHVLGSAPDVATTPLSELPVQPVTDRYEMLSFGGGGEATHITYGVVRFDHVVAERLVALLPDVLHVDRWEDEVGEAGWLHHTLRLITREARDLRPGGETVLTRLADVLIIQVIRTWLDRAPEANRGWLGALRDGQVGRALADLHRTPEAPWTLDTLARAAGMSRSAFAARFTRLVGEPAMRYLARWRLSLARRMLRDGDAGIAEIAAAVGYGSEAAFGRAFKREYGVSPGRARS